MVRTTDDTTVTNADRFEPKSHCITLSASLAGTSHHTNSQQDRKGVGGLTTQKMRLRSSYNSTTQHKPSHSNNTTRSKLFYHTTETISFQLCNSDHTTIQHKPCYSNNITLTTLFYPITPTLQIRPDYNSTLQLKFETQYLKLKVKLK